MPEGDNGNGENLKRIRQWAQEQLGSGQSKSEVRSAIIDAGYSERQADEIVYGRYQGAAEESPKKKTAPHDTTKYFTLAIGAIVILFILAVVFLIFQYTGEDGAISPTGTNIRAEIERFLGEMTDLEWNEFLQESQVTESNTMITRKLVQLGDRTRIVLNIKYEGVAPVGNFIVYDIVPKDFARDANSMTVKASGARTAVIRQDPEYLFIYPGAEKGDEFIIIYDAFGILDENVINAFIEPRIYSKTYAEGEKPAKILQLEEAQDKEKLESGSTPNPYTPSTDIGGTTQDDELVPDEGTDTEVPDVIERPDEQTEEEQTEGCQGTGDDSTCDPDCSYAEGESCSCANECAFNMTCSGGICVAVDESCVDQPDGTACFTDPDNVFPDGACCGSACITNYQCSMTDGCYNETARCDGGCQIRDDCALGCVDSFCANDFTPPVATITLGDFIWGNDEVDTDGEVFATLFNEDADSNITSCKINWAGSWIEIDYWRTYSSYGYGEDDGEKTVQYSCTNGVGTNVTVSDTITISICSGDGNDGVCDADCSYGLNQPCGCGAECESGVCVDGMCLATCLEEHTGLECSTDDSLPGSRICVIDACIIPTGPVCDPAFGCVDGNTWCNPATRMGEACGDGRMCEGNACVNMDGGAPGVGDIYPESITAGVPALFSSDVEEDGTVVGCDFHYIIDLENEDVVAMNVPALGEGEAFTATVTYTFNNPGTYQEIAYVSCEDNEGLTGYSNAANITAS